MNGRCNLYDIQFCILDLLVLNRNGTMETNFCVLDAEMSVGSIKRFLELHSRYLKALYGESLGGMQFIRQSSVYVEAVSYDSDAVVTVYLCGQVVKRDEIRELYGESLKLDFTHCGGNAIKDKVQHGICRIDQVNTLKHGKSLVNIMLNGNLS